MVILDTVKARWCSLQKNQTKNKRLERSTSRRKTRLVPNGNILVFWDELYYSNSRKISAYECRFWLLRKHLNYMRISSFLTLKHCLMVKRLLELKKNNEITYHFLQDDILDFASKCAEERLSQLERIMFSRYAN